MSLKETIKMFRYIPNKTLNAVVLGIFCMCTLIYVFPNPYMVAVGGMWAVYPISYAVMQLESVQLCSFMQSAEKMKKSMATNLALFMVICNLGSFVLFGGVRTVLAGMLSVQDTVVPFLMMYCFYMLLMEIYPAFLYKKPVAGYTFIGLMVLVLLLANHAVLQDKIQRFSEQIPLGGMLAGTVVVCLIAPLLFYGLTMALYKYPYSDFMAKRVMRMEGM